MDEPSELRDALVAEALRRGFVAAGVTTVDAFPDSAARARTLRSDGHMDGLDWFHARRVEAAADPAARHPWAQSLLALAWPCPPTGNRRGDVPTGAPGRPRGRMAAFACLHDGDGATADYHRVLSRATGGLVAWLADRVPGLRAHRAIDHGWMFDRSIAERAGLGFAGRNTLLLTPEGGSHVLLAEVLLSAPLPPSPPRPMSGCGRCRACIPACPTGAIGPWGVDARRCISALTIEHRGAVDPELRPLLGTWVLGCDRCQQVCPIDHRGAPEAADDGPASTADGPVPFPDLVELLLLDEAEFDRRFAGTSAARPGRAALARNAAYALGNAGDVLALPALEQTARDDPDPVVRDAAGWARDRLRAAADTIAAMPDRAPTRATGPRRTVAP